VGDGEGLNIDRLAGAHEGLAADDHGDVCGEREREKRERL
jgi:hypothetical protein